MWQVIWTQGEKKLITEYGNVAGYTDMEKGNTLQSKGMRQVI
jgi:hypothetical protein